MMEHQGKKATHDFLSLHNNKDSRPLINKGFNLRTCDFLQPLEQGGKEAEEIRNVLATAVGKGHVLPGGIGTFSIGHVSGGGSTAVVKREGSTCGEGEVGYAAFSAWDRAGSSSATDSGLRAPPIAAAAASKQPRKRSMDRSSGFDDDDDDESYRGELGGKGDGRNGGGEQRPTTPRSKHSATEQRRRSKINDRFQILRELIPHSDQKRDKASFLLEVIEYVRFLQEKAQKYESTYPGWTEEDAKLMPWNSQVPGDRIADPSEVIRNGSVPTEFLFSGNGNVVSGAPAMFSATLNPSELDMSNGVSDKAAEDSIVFASKVAAASLSQPDLYASVGRETDISQTHQLISDVDNMASQSQSQWLRSPCPTECAVTGEILGENEELAVDEGTISVSSAYSEGLFTALSQTLQSSGIDLSQASISVNINLGKRSTNRRPTATTTMSSAKDHGEPSSGNRVVGLATVGSSGEESEQACKRQKSDDS